MKNNILILTLCMILFGIILIPLIEAHTIDKGPETKTIEEYEISFSTNPKFPITNKEIHLDFVIKDEEGNKQSGLSVKIEIHKGEKTIELSLQEENEGHYSIENKFVESGQYEIHPIINRQELETEFKLELDSFGKNGLLGLGTIIIFILILLVLMYRDCKKVKGGMENGKKGAVNKNA